MVQDQQTIGYSLPANLLGNPGSAPPFPPWEPASVCTNKSCDSNPAKCYRHTHLAEIVHSDEISEKVENFVVSGVSMPQEASSKPTNLFLGIESEEQDGMSVCLTRTCHMTEYSTCTCMYRYMYMYMYRYMYSVHVHVHCNTVDIMLCKSVVHREE